MLLMLWIHIRQSKEWETQSNIHEFFYIEYVLEKSNPWSTLLCFQGFYKIRVVPHTGRTVGRHALMILGRGRTVEGQDFFIAQNSWEKTWGVNGYGRLIIDDGMSCMAFWPRPYRGM